MQATAIVSGSSSRRRRRHAARVVAGHRAVRRRVAERDGVAAGSDARDRHRRADRDRLRSPPSSWSRTRRDRRRPGGRGRDREAPMSRRRPPRSCRGRGARRDLARRPAPLDGCSCPRSQASATDAPRGEPLDLRLVLRRWAGRPAIDADGVAVRVGLRARRRGGDSRLPVADQVMSPPPPQPSQEMAEASARTARPRATRETASVSPCVRNGSERLTNNGRGVDSASTAAARQVKRSTARRSLLAPGGAGMSLALHSRDRWGCDQG